MAEETKGIEYERALRGVQMETLGDAIRDFYKYVSGPSEKRRPAARILGKIWGVDVCLAEHPVEHWEPGRVLSKTDELWVAGSLSDVTKAIQFEVNDRARCCGPALERAVIPTYEAACTLMAEMGEHCLYSGSWPASEVRHESAPCQGYARTDAVANGVGVLEHKTAPLLWEPFVVHQEWSAKSPSWHVEAGGQHYTIGVDPGFESDRSVTVVMRVEQDGGGKKATVVWSGDTPRGGWTHGGIRDLVQGIHEPQTMQADDDAPPAVATPSVDGEVLPYDWPRRHAVQREWPFFKEIMARPFDPLKEVKPSLLAAAASSMPSLRQIDEDQARLALRQAANRAGLDQDKAVRTATEIAMSTGRTFAEVCDSERQAILAGERSATNWIKVWCRYLVDCEAFDRGVPHKLSKSGEAIPFETGPSQQYARKRKAELLATCPKDEEAACLRYTNHLSYEGLKAHAASDDDLRAWGLWRPQAADSPAIKSVTLSIQVGDTVTFEERTETRDVFNHTTGKFSTLTVTVNPRDQERDTVRVQTVKNTFDMKCGCTETGVCVAHAREALGVAPMVAPSPDPARDKWLSPPTVEHKDPEIFTYSPGERDPFPIGQAPGETEAWARALAILKAGG